MENTSAEFNPDVSLYSSFADPRPLDITSANSSQDVCIVDNHDMAQIKLNRQPKRILHFCDGTIEEYSSDDDETDHNPPTEMAVNPKTLTWGPWFWYQTLVVGNTSLKVCDYLGENLASFFGITTPKYQYEIDEYKRMMAEEEEHKKREDLEMGGWTEGSSQPGVEAVELPPMSSFSEIPCSPKLPSSAAHNAHGDSSTNERF